jgi:hypothetical protein
MTIQTSPRHPTFGQQINPITFSTLLTILDSPLMDARLYIQLKTDPQILGFVLFARQELGPDPAYAVMPFGPNCKRFKTLDDARGIAIGDGVPLTDPRYATMYATAPVSIDFDAAILEATRRGMESLPTIWAKRKRWGVWLGDRLVNPTNGIKYVVLTYGDNETHMLVVPEDMYSEELVPDPTSPSGHRKKNSEHWRWVNLGEAVRNGFTILERQGMPSARFVLKREDEHP